MADPAADKPQELNSLGLPLRPRGKALSWTAKDIARLSEVTPEDVASAKASFRRLAPKPYKRLLDKPAKKPKA